MVEAGLRTSMGLTTGIASDFLVHLEAKQQTDREFVTRPPFRKHVRFMKCPPVRNLPLGRTSLPVSSND